MTDKLTRRGLFGLFGKAAAVAAVVPAVAREVRAAPQPVIVEPDEPLYDYAAYGVTISCVDQPMMRAGQWPPRRSTNTEWIDDEHDD